MKYIIKDIKIKVVGPKEFGGEAEITVAELQFEAEGKDITSIIKSLAGIMTPEKEEV